MIPEERRNKILEKLREKELYTLKQLQKEIGVSRVTIQRDINILEKKGLIEKIHGGAKIKNEIPSVIDSRFEHRLNSNYNKKLEIAEKAINFVKDDSIIFIDSSTTCYVFAKILFKRNFNNLVAITTSPAIINEITENTKIKVICAPGVIRKDFNMISGQFVLDFLNKINIESAFISAAGVSKEYGITTSDIELKNILSTVFRISEEVNLLVDSSKFTKRGMLEICSLDSCQRIITDCGIDPKLVENVKMGNKLDLIF